MCGIERDEYVRDPDSNISWPSNPSRQIILPSSLRTADPCAKYTIHVLRPATSWQTCMSSTLPCPTVGSAESDLRALTQPATISKPSEEKMH